MTWLRIHEGAEIYGVSPWTLRRKLNKGELPCYKPFGKKGRVYLIKEELEQFLLASRTGPAVPSGNAAEG